MTDGGRHAVESWPPWLVALTFGLASAASFPVGAAIGSLYTPAPSAASFSRQGRESEVHVRRHWVAGMMAFGGGCLLFAVTVELYGDAIHELETGGYSQGVGPIFTTIAFAMLGAIAFVDANRRLAGWLGEDRAAGEAATEETPLLAPGIFEPTAGALPASTSSRSMKEYKLQVRKNLLVGMESWFGVFISGVPEGFLLGIFAAEGRLSVVLVVSLLLSNFPTAVASASLLKEGGRGDREVIGMWTLLFVLTGLLAAVVPLLIPGGQLSMATRLVADAIEGLAGGSMLACIAGVMLPEAYHVQGDVAGLVTVAGFLTAVVIKVFGGLVEDWTNHVAVSQAQSVFAASSKLLQRAACEHGGSALRGLLCAT